MKNSILDRIQSTLQILSDGNHMHGVSYGAQTEEPATWDYFVFTRLATRKSSNRVDRETYYQVHIVRENYIPEGLVEEVIKALETKDSDGTKLKATADDISYNYTTKPNTDMIIEVATITFVHPEKRC